MTTSQGKLTVADISVIAVYIVSVIAVGVWSMFQSKRGTVSGYFLAGRFMTFLPVGMSLFASNIGSEHLIGLSGSGAAAGISVGAFEFNALMFLQLLGFVFLPVYISSGVFTLPEYIHKRFGGNRIRIFLAVLSLLLYIFTKISVNMYSGALFIQQSVGWNLYLSIFGLLALTGICTLTGGLATVIYLDTLMAFVMVGGAAIMTFIGFKEIGWYSGLRAKYPNAMADEVLLGNTTCGIPRHDSFRLLRDPIDSDLPWPGFMFGQTSASIWYWCADQVIVQRALAAKSLSHAQGGAVLAGYIKILPMFIMVMPGMISRVLFPNEVGCVDPDKCMAICESRTGCTNIALPKLVLEIMPSGLRGMMLAVMMAALMSDLTSIFNSASTIFTMDVYRSIRKQAGTRELMIVGRVFILILCVIGVLWVPVLKEFQGGQLFIYIQAVSAYLSPPIAAVYLLAIFWQRSNEQGTFWAMMVGFAVGITRMILDFTYPAPSCSDAAQDTRPPIIKKLLFHYFYVALLLFVLTLIVCVVISLLTEPPDEELIIRTTVWTKYDSRIRSDELSEQNDMEENDQNEIRRRFTSTGSETDGATLEMKERQTTTKDSDDNSRVPLMTSHTIYSSNESITNQDVIVHQPRPSCCKRALYFICGLSEDPIEERKSMDEQKDHIREVISLKQDPTAKKFLHINCILVLVVCIFLLVFFTVPDGGPTGPTIPLPYMPFVLNGTRPYE
ncbi:sodium/mannose cotransporter SLC5A10-like isoform X2 [Clytia hemisphaerica]|uniref:Sodium/myo-inositol cotransporter n=1 Tax=Clytia hemisphaerica TaxID=252671 RepID=A0A7M5X053_9CNID